MAEVKEIELEVKSEIEKYKAETDIIIDDAGSFEYAGEVILKGKSILKEIADRFEEPVKAAYRAHKSIKDLQNELERPVKTMVADLQGKANAYLTEQERLRRIEQKRLDDERIAAEAAERARLEAEAKKAAKKGDADKAAALKAEAETVMIIPEIAVTEVEKTTHTDAGTIGTQSDIKVTITDQTTLLKAIIEQGKFELVEIKEAALKRYIKAMGLSEFPGVDIEEVKKATFRSK